MKNVLYFATINILAFHAFSLSSCKKDDPLMESPDNNDAEVLFTGSFEDADHETKGKVEITDDGSQQLLVITGFETDNGPDLFVYLSEDKSANQFINLGELKSTSGDFYYEIDQTIDYSTNDHVLIWCKQFSVLFGSAELMEQ